MKFKCVIFDLDGTLIDSLQGILDACNITFEQLGINIKKGYEESKDFIGAGATEFAKRALKGVKVSPELERKVMEVFLINYRKTQVTSAKPYPEITQMLLNLKKNGTYICIASNKPHMLLEEVVGHLFPDVKFDVALGQKPNTPEKPDPYIIYQILDKLHVDPEDCIYVGDGGSRELEVAGELKMQPLQACWYLKKGTKQPVWRLPEFTPLEKPMDLIKYC